MRGESDSYKYSQVVIYSCDKGFILFGNSTIYCTVSKSDVGQWSSPPPQCIGNLSYSLCTHNFIFMYLCILYCLDGFQDK